MKTASPPKHSKILILDFGSQYTQVIARRIRELQVYSEVVPYSLSAAEVRKLQPNGIILSGGPASVYDKGAPQIDKEIFSLGIPVLGICYGLMQMAHHLGGKVVFTGRREYGAGMLNITNGSQLFAGLGLLLIAGTLAFVSVHRFEPNVRQSPAAAVAMLKKMNFTRVFNDYDFGGYLIANGVPTFIDGRTELFGEKFMVDHNDANGLIEPENLFRLLDEYRIEATLLRTQSAATKLLDHIDGWQKVYADDIATVHVRKAGAVHTAEPTVDPQVK